jgi:ubiquinone/menaquinone biosynthesis C-methylase UbiE
MYKGFAGMYDALMADTPYEQWAEYIDKVFCERLGIKHRDILVLDLACGTGNITLLLNQMGYDMIGVDSSVDMLAEASRKAEDAKILFLHQDIRKLNLYGTVDAAVSVCDGFNYILSEKELLAVFKRVRLFLNKGGIFIFDMNTEYKFKELNNLTFEDTGAGGEACEWQSKYNPVTKINEYHVTFFSCGGTKTEPFAELHRQRAYAPQDICNMLLDAGFVSVAMRDGYSDNTIKADSARVVFIAMG